MCRRKRLSWKKRSAATESGRGNVCLLHSLLLSFFWAGLCSFSGRPVGPAILCCWHCGRGACGAVAVPQAVFCQRRAVNDGTRAAFSAPAGQRGRYPAVASVSAGGRYRPRGPRPEVRKPGMVVAIPAGLAVALRCGYHGPRGPYCCGGGTRRPFPSGTEAPAARPVAGRDPEAGGIPLLRGDDEQLLAERVREFLCTQRPEGAA